jgi:hypothetical protein
MAGNLMAKKKAEEAATQKALTDEMAKLDASKIRYPDVKTWNVKYENLLSAGTNASKNPTDVKSQIQYKTALNEAKSWLVGNNYIKENFDVPNVKVAYDSDYNDKDRADAKNKTLLTQEEILASEPKLYNKKDKKDYLLEIANAFSPSIYAQDDKFRYKNDLSKSSKELKVASDLHATANLETETGASALAEIATGLGVDLGTPTGKKAAINKYVDTIWKLAQPNLKGGVENLPEDNSLSIGFGGWNKKNESLYSARTEDMFNVSKGNSQAITRLQNKLGPGSTINLQDPENLIITYKYKEKNADGNDVIKDAIYTIPKTKGLMAFYLAFNPLYDAVSGMGNKDITNEEMLTYLKDPKQSQWLKIGDKSTLVTDPNYTKPTTKTAAQVAAAKAAAAANAAKKGSKPTKKGGKVTNVQNIFGTTTPTPVKPGP